MHVLNCNRKIHTSLIPLAGLLIFLSVSSCLVIPSYMFGGNDFFYVPGDLKDENARKAAIDEFSPYLKGRAIFLDPGHGGDDNKNRSPRRDVSEAEVNLRVAMQLKKFLEEAGAVVYASRTANETVTLEKRTALLKTSGAEIFISIHHNAPRSKGNWWTNYTATYYHALKGEYGYDPFSHDLARYIQRDLAYAMRNSGGPGSFDGTYSDYNVFPHKGFAVLRNAPVPAVLVECSFFTNPVEELRLSRERFNRVQAWAIFKGLGKFYKDGYPVITNMQVKRKSKDAPAEITVSVLSKRTIDKKMVTIFWDRNELFGGITVNAGSLRIIVPKAAKNEHEIKVLAPDVKGRYNYPFVRRITVED